MCQYEVQEEKMGPHTMWRVVFSSSHSGLYTTKQAAQEAARRMFELDEAIAKNKRYPWEKR